MNRRFAAAVAATGTAVLLSVAGCGSSGGGSQAGQVDPPTGQATTPAPSTAPPTTAPPTTSPPATTPPADPSPAPTGTEPLRLGDSGEEVEALQRQLDQLGYWVGDADGEFGGLTQQAVYAVQKAAGADPDGVVGPLTREALADEVRPSARSEDGRVVEVDLDRQLMMLVVDGDVEQVFNTSTGTFEYYTHDGEEYLADTPRGEWEIGWQVDGWDPGPLGRLYRPKYFHSQGIAVHGYTEVPPYPASHGCVRVSLAAMDWLWDNDELPIGTSVWVY